jgi:addiction module HigA family antidote
MVRIPKNRAPAHPGKILLNEYLEPLGVPQTKFAERIGVPVQRVNEIIKGKRGVTEDTALRFAAALNTSPGFWLNLQQRWNLYQAMHSEEAKDIERIEPFRDLAHA